MVAWVVFVELVDPCGRMPRSKLWVLGVLACHHRLRSWLPWILVFLEAVLDLGI